MNPLRWLTHHSAETHPDDVALRPVDLALPQPDAIALVEQVIRALPRWRVKSVDPTAGTLIATRHTRLFRFVDDVMIYLEPIPGGTRVRASSKSRIGTGDFGQNRRNLLEFLTPLRSAR